MRLERIAMDKHSALLRKSANYGRREPYGTSLWLHNLITLEKRYNPIFDIDLEPALRRNFSKSITLIRRIFFSIKGITRKDGYQSN
jgi:hypothetical protein